VFFISLDAKRAKSLRPIRSGQWRIAGKISATLGASRQSIQSALQRQESISQMGLHNRCDVSATPTVDGDAVYFPDWEQPLCRQEEQWPTHLVSQDLRVRRSRRSGLSCQSRGGLVTRLIIGHSQFQRGSQRRERDGK